MELAVRASMPRWRRSGFVTKRSSPTSWTFSPRASVSVFQPSQSSSSMPSSIERIGYLPALSAQYSESSPAVSERFSCVRTYLPPSKISEVAGSSAMPTCSPGL
ncbi:unannotated protein [freshwater metagenome]|uniref:Unannotated protein n=1 Tax=freshwater metagenome TaxID=449393 RepID=A0A6J7J8F5_9ZZZZ